MDFNEEKIQSRFPPSLNGRKVHFLKETDSTNTYAADLLNRGTQEGEIVIADCQTHGRGRMERVWHSPPGKNIFTSIILKPVLHPALASQVTLTAGVAVAEVISEFCNGKVTVKWPNDVLIGGKKVCGILSEMRTRDDKIEYVIVGIGINVNMDKGDFPGQLQESSTSLKQETEKYISRLDFAANLFDCFDTWYHTLITRGFDPIRDKWVKYSDIIGREIDVSNRDRTKRGRVAGLDNIGALVIYDKKEKKSRVLSGDVTLIGD
ncbi:MAG: biotin--[acetyl-CoA-carboxylase] ligase [Deltaproteobacteria bacterium]|nr:biotin--[acetyl-CoA-carboxylase] ligase [Deltaproteobacteria bacterium]